MPITIGIDIDWFPDGKMLGVAGLRIPNGGSVILTAEQERDFIASHGITVRDKFRKSKRVFISGRTSLVKKTNGKKGVK